MLLAPPLYFTAAFPETLKDRITRPIGDWILPWYLRLRQRFAPAYHGWFRHYWWVLGFDAVQEVFTKWQTAPVTNYHKTDALRWDPPFLLALRDKDDNYNRIHAAVRQHWSDNRIDTLRAIARGAFESRLAQLVKSSHRIDAIQDYMIPGFLEIVDRYYGVKIRDPKDESDFVHSLFLISRFFFGHHRGEPEVRPHAQEAFDQAMRVLQEVIDDARVDPSPEPGVLSDLISAGVTDENLSSWLLGMILGFIPTSTNGQGRVLDLLLRRPEAMEWATKTVNSAKFLAVCHEALRLNYILPGLFRETRESLTLGAGTTRPISIKQGETLLVSHQTAMFDPKHFPAPKKFDPDRPKSKNLNYGHDLHFCVGWDIADIVMEETFRALVLAGFSRPRHGRWEWRGAYPWVREIAIGS
jgi:cytochrome P450